MILGGNPKPYYGQSKTVRNFAFIPLKLVGGGWVWLEHYYTSLTYTRTYDGENKGYWKFNYRHINNPTNIT